MSCDKITITQRSPLTVVSVAEQGMPLTVVSVAEQGMPGPPGVAGLSSLDLWLGNWALVKDLSGNIISKVWDDGKHIDYTYTDGDITRVDYYPTGSHYYKTFTPTGSTNVKVI